MISTSTHIKADLTPEEMFKKKVTSGWLGWEWGFWKDGGAPLVESVSVKALGLRVETDKKNERENSRTRSE